MAMLLLGWEGCCLLRVLLAENRVIPTDAHRLLLLLRLLLWLWRGLLEPLCCGMRMLIGAGVVEGIEIVPIIGGRAGIYRGSGQAAHHILRGGLLHAAVMNAHPTWDSPWRERGVSK